MEADVHNAAAQKKKKNLFPRMNYVYFATLLADATLFKFI